MHKKYTRVNILRCVFILRCANQPESKFKLRSHGFYRQEGTSRQRSGKGAIRKRFPLQKPRWEKTKLTIRYLYHETIVSRMGSYFPNRWPLSYLNLTRSIFVGKFIISGLKPVHISFLYLQNKKRLLLGVHVDFGSKGESCNGQA